MPSLKNRLSKDRLGPDESEFRQSDSFYLASVGSTGWPYVQHRGGPRGFLKVIDGRPLRSLIFWGTNNLSAPGT